MYRTNSFAAWAALLRGMTVSHVWNGHGTALFIEFGKLTERRRRNGTPAPPQGTFTVMLDDGWRIAGRAGLLCGSHTHGWSRFKRLHGCRVTEAVMSGRLAIAIAFTRGLHLQGRAAGPGFPGWTLFDNRHTPNTWLSAERGRLHYGQG